MTRSQSVCRHWAPVAVAFCLLTGLGAPASAANWVVRPAESTLGLSGTVSGSAQDAQFERFTVTIAYDPVAPEAAHVAVEIDLSSIATGDEDYDRDLVSKSWFNAKEAPTAAFVADGFEPKGEGAFVANGTLTLRGVSVPVALAFTLAVDGAIATMDGEASLNRFDYGVGAKTDETWIGKDVAVRVKLVADRVD